MKKGAIYARVSTDRQEYDRQIQELKDYAYRNDIDIKYVFEEKMSGLNSERPEYNKLMQLTKDDIDIVLIWELSRLSRKSVEIQSDIEKLTEKGINLYIKNNNIFTLDENGNENSLIKLAIAMIATFAEEEIKTSKQRSKSAKQHYILKEGRSYTSQAPLGYYLENKHLKINADEVGLVKLIFDLCINGYSYYGIAVYLNANGYKTKRNTNWNPSTIKSMLSNSVYIGKPKYCLKSVTSKSKVIDRKNSRKVVESVTLNCPELAILSEETFLKAEEARKIRRSKACAAGTSPYLLKHLIRCPNCNRYYTFDRSVNRRRYKCQSKYNKTRETACKHSPAFEAHKLDSCIWECVKRYCLEELKEDKLSREKQPILDKISECNNIIANIEDNIKHLNEEAEQIINVAMDIKIKTPNLISLYDKKIKEAEVIDKEVAKLNNEIERYKNNIRNYNSQLDAIENMKNLDSYLDAVDFNTKYELLHKVIKVIYPYTNNINCSVLKIYFKSGYSFLIGYYGKKNYCIQIEETDCVAFKDGEFIVKTMNPDFTFNTKTYSISEFLEIAKSDTNTIENKRKAYTKKAQ